jgi:hypothetical protein
VHTYGGFVYDGWGPIALQLLLCPFWLTPVIMHVAVATSRSFVPWAAAVAQVNNARRGEKRPESAVGDSTQLNI